MEPERFRAYAAEPAISRRVVGGEKLNVQHQVENPAFEGDVADGAASFDAGATLVTRVVFYGGAPEEEVVLGQVAVNQSGQISVELPLEA